MKANEQANNITVLPNSITLFAVEVTAPKPMSQRFKFAYVYQLENDNFVEMHAIPMRAI